MSDYVFGVDIGGSSVKYGAFRADTGGMIDKWQTVTDFSNSGENIISDVGKSLLAKFDEMGIAPSDVLGVGVGVPGIVTPDGTVTRLVNLGWNKPRRVADELSDIIGCPVKTLNDANLAALGEYCSGAGKGCEDMILVTMGTGIGCGIISGGKLITGSLGAAGEFGHIHVNDNEIEPCGCGSFGCLEQYCTIDGFVRIAARILKDSSDPSRLREMIKGDAIEFSVKDIFDLAKKGDKIANTAVNIGCSYLGRAAATAANILNPEKIIIGGGISSAGNIIPERMREGFERYAFPDCKGTEIIPARLVNDAGIIGASRVILDTSCF